VLILVLNLVLKELHRCTSRVSLQTLAPLLKFFGRLIAQRRVQAQPIVILLDELPDIFSQMFQVVVLVGVNFFSLKRLHETFTARVVIGICWPAHARNHAVVLEDFHIFCGSVLLPPIRVMHQTGFWLSIYVSVGWITFCAAQTVANWTTIDRNVRAHPEDWVTLWVACVLMRPVLWYCAAWLRRRKLAELNEVKKILDDMDGKSVP
jgi:hypothetical protein